MVKGFLLIVDRIELLLLFQFRVPEIISGKFNKLLQRKLGSDSRICRMQIL